MKEGGLISRGAVESRGLFQTEQYSDETDRQVNVFNDIFFDSDDIHSRVKSYNKYGPMLFEYSIDLLDELPYQIKITRSNPESWSKEGLKSDYFSDLTELQEKYIKSEFCQHLTIRNIDDVLPFKPYLNRIVIDKYPYYSDQAFCTIKNILQTKNINTPVEFRNCKPNCICKNNYDKMQTTQKLKFWSIDIKNTL